MNKKLLMGIIAGVCVVALVLGLVLGLNNCQGTTDPTVEPTPSATVEPTDPTEKPTKPPKETEAPKPTDPPEPGGTSYYSGMPDFGWYDADEIYEEYTLYTADQFMAFAELVNGMGVKFENVTIKLGANMVFNNGDASKWTRDDNELLNWAPIGANQANYFAGTLDGQGYYISGLYGVRGRDNGFMLYTQKATIQNLAIINSYFCNTGGNQKDAQVLGGVVGRGYGITLKNIYCDAILEGGGYHTGGIVAFARDTWTLNKTDDAKDVLIDSCVFAGTIKGCVGVNVGGILGGTDGVNVKLISNCLNLGSIESTKGSVGGIVGAIHKDTVVTNCVNAGKVVSTDKNSDRAALVGNAASSSTVKNSYFANVPGAKPFGSGTPSSSVVLGVDRASMKGANVSKVMTALDFKATWTAYKDGYPIPTGVAKMFDAHKKAVVEDAGNGGPVYKNPTASVGGKVDTSWYKEGQKTFTLTTADQLYGLAKLVNDGKTNFKGVTIKLGADIVVNQGDASKWNAETAGLRAWTPIGPNSSKYFAGTLDGQGHYISGLYTVVDRDSGFICYAMNATVKNLAIVNSYFENFGRQHANGYLSAQVLATFVGRSYGSTLQNLYSDARIVIPETAQGYNTGGIAGFAKSNGTEGEVAYGASLIDSCVFAGTITTNNEKDSLTGGILGGTDGSYATVKNCLNRGQINAKGTNIGGIAGKLDKESVLEDCVNVGNVSNKVALAGSVSGNVEVIDCYYVKSTGTKAYGGGVPASSSVAGLTRDEMKGTNVGTVMTGLDFKSAWTALKDDYPIPTGVKEMYAKHKQPIPGGESDGSTSGGESGGNSGSTHVPGTPDTTWYEDGKNEFTLTTADQLYGFAQLVSEGVSFQGVTVKLGADIVINEGDAATWKTTAPARKWTPVGTKTSYFAGSFDGQGHYISGLYTAEKENNGLFAWVVNAEIKNLAIINSYFSTVGRDNGGNGQMLAAFAARAYGTTLKNLYTDAIVHYAADNTHKGDWCTGGIAAILTSPKAGQATEDQESGAIVVTKPGVLENCVFAGSILTGEASSSVGSQVGGILGGSNSRPVEIKNCLFIGQIESNDNNVGGIVGGISDGCKIEACVSNGKIVATAQNLSNWGAVVGNSGGVTSVKNCYYSDALNLPLYGKKATLNDELTNTKLSDADMRGEQVATTMSKLTFGENGWTAQVNDYPVPTGVLEMYKAHKKPHVHAWSEAWTSDENGHWHACGNVGCDVTDPANMKDYGAHVFDNEKDKSCNTCGYEREVPDSNDGAIDGTLSKPSGYIGGDNTWYKPDSGITEYTLNSVDELYGFAYLVSMKGVSFEGITIKLGKNMVINEGDASTWGITPPALVWKPIGTGTSKYFAGTFDGQGHYISGLYTNEKQNNGLFAWVVNAEIKNLAIINSYFSTVGRDNGGNGQMLAAFAARAYGTTLKNLYTNAIVHYAADNTHKGDWCTAGIAGIVTSPAVGQTSEVQEKVLTVTGKGKIENCVFAGSILTGEASATTGAGVGGILGSANGRPVEIRNCLFIGKIESNDKQVGGIAGILANGCTVESSVVAGTMSATAQNLASWGAIVGESGGTVSLKNNYYSEALNLPLYGKKATLNDELTNTKLSDAKMKGLQVVNTMANLTFGDKGWTAQEGDYPVPTSMKIVVNHLRKLTADAAAPNIITQPTMDNLTVEAESVDGGALSYQWYMSTDGTTFNKIDGATGASYTHDPSLTGNIWYKCEVTNTNNNTSGAKTAKVESVVVKVHVHTEATTMSHNDNGHWYACTVADCDAAVESLPSYKEHVYDNDQDATCNVAECGYERHIHSWNTWGADEYYGWHECNVAGCPVTENAEKDGYHAHAYEVVNGVATCPTCQHQLTVSYYDGTPDKTWYKESETNFVLFHADQLFGLKELVNDDSHNFNGKTVTLAVNMVINKGGDARTWSADNVPAYSWTPIGTDWNNKCFAGTFDGQNHYISGLYSKLTTNNGMFCYTQNATIKNLALVNSYFENGNGEVLGSIVGRGRGIIMENVYSSAILVGGTKQIGGLIGYFQGVNYSNNVGIPVRTCSFKNCVFAGTISGGSDKNVGGLAGADNGGGSNTIDNFLFVGSINAGCKNYVGGIVGNPVPDLTIRTSFVAGKITKATGNICAISGWVSAPSSYSVTKTTTFSDSYYVSESYPKMYDGHDTKGQLVQNVSAVADADAKGINALTNMPLLESSWTARADDYPVPTSILPLLQKLPVDVAIPVINMHPGNFGYHTVNDTVTPLEVTATSPDNAVLSYQWYVNDVRSNVGGTPIAGATQNTYKPDLTGMAAGDAKYFYCVVTNTNANATGVQAFSKASDPKCVHIHKVDTSSYTGHNATQHWSACTVDGCGEAAGHENHDAGTDKTCATCGFLKANYYNGGVDTEWYVGHENETTYTLTTPAQLYGLAKLVNDGTTKFEGKTIKLGANMVINTGNYTTWGTTAPSNKWTPIGSSKTAYFAGKFDGQGHYISGVYTYMTENNAFFGWTGNAEIKNLAIIDSYFETYGRSSDGKGQMFATFAARAYGTTLQNLYSNAILDYAVVKENAVGDWCTGGIAGIVTSPKYGATSEAQDSINVTNQGVVDSCVFAGTILTGEAGQTGGLVGGILGYSNGKPVTVSNCLFTGSIESNDNSVGGIAGGLHNYCGIEACVSAGTITATKTGLTNWGPVVGRLYGGTSVSVTNCYYNNAINVERVDGSENTNTFTGIDTNTKLTDTEMKGDAAKTNMPKLFEEQTPAWKVTEGYPIPVGVVIP